MTKRYEVVLTIKAEDEEHIYSMVQNMTTGFTATPSVDSIKEIDEDN